MENEVVSGLGSLAASLFLLLPSKPKRDPGMQLSESKGCIPVGMRFYIVPSSATWEKKCIVIKFLLKGEREQAQHRTLPTWSNPEHVGSIATWGLPHSWALLTALFQAALLPPGRAQCRGKAGSVLSNVQLSSSLNRWVLQSFNCIKCKKNGTLYQTNT